MLSLIEVKCPHCGARGQIMLPPIGSIIIGPCPECQELVIVFCGRVLALEKEIMLHGSFDEKREHMMEVLTEFLRERIDKLIVEEAEMREKAARGEEAPKGSAPEETAAEPSARSAISQEEMDAFKNMELALIDDKDAFEKIFG